MKHDINAALILQTQSDREHGLQLQSGRGHSQYFID